MGRRPRATEVYVVTGDEVGPLEHPAYRSDAPLDWGELSAGALELAFALLACSTGRRPPDAICRIFRRDVIARLDHTGFVLGDGEIALWLLTTFGDHEPQRASLLHLLALSRVADWLRSRRPRD